MITAARVIGAWALAAALGCGDDLGSGRDAGPCREDCAPYACGSGGDFCLTSCSSEAQCAPRHVCQGGACVGTECTAETAREVCGPYACLNGNCAEDCASAPCADGFYCRGNQNECVPHCTEPDDPLCEGYLCNVEFGECEVLCDDQVRCAEGYTCDRNHRCR
ncbi:MAG TPA: hypothetical protein VFU21_15435 [Kofleriaceae bacterium]|nr:hypothetical protein [Kofleriaceae bacterium]